MTKSLDIKEILKIIPHRYPFILIDRILELDEVKRKAVAIKNVTINEPFFQGHFPGQPVMPGVLIVEAFAQVGVVMALSLKENEGKLVFFGGIDNARFRKPVVPGDQLRLELEILWVRGPIGKAHAAAFVEQTLVAEGDFIFSIVEKEKGGVKIHPTATVHPSAILGKDVEIGAYTVVGPDVKIGDRTKIQQHCTILRWTTLGQDNQIYQGVTIGAPPQDLKYQGERVEVVIGDRNVIREYVAIHHPTGEGAKTIIGNDNFIMTHSHIPHNCQIGNGTILASYCGISGHAQIGDQVVIGGMAGIHQFVRIGRLAMIGGQSKITQDIPPFMLVDGNPAQVRGINSIGLKRRGISFEAQSEIKKAFRLIYESSLNAAQAAKEIRQRLRPLPEIDQLARFLEEESARGISKKTAIDAEAEELILPEIPELGI